MNCVPGGTIPLVWKPLLHVCGLLLTPVLDVDRLVPGKGVHTPGLEGALFLSLRCSSFSPPV